jgi:putative transposase
MTYSVDLRERMVANLQEESMRATARRFRMSLSSVYRINRRYQETGQLHAKHSGGRRAAVDPEGAAWLQDLVSHEPDLSLAALSERYQQAWGRAVSTSAMDRTLRRLKLSRKKRRTMIRSGTARRCSSSVKRITVSSLNSIPTA